MQPPDRLAKAIRWQTIPLSKEQVASKLAALKAHRTQYGSNAGYLLSFIRTDEMFGDFPPLVLRPATGTAQPRATSSAPASRPPDELTDSERARFIGVESRTMRLEDGYLVISIELSAPLGRGVGMSVYAFGYRDDRSFVTMPKLHVQIGDLRYLVLDQGKVLPHDTVQVSRQARQITVRIPLKALGDPQRVLTSARTYLGDVPLNTASWRVIELPPGP